MVASVSKSLSIVVISTFLFFLSGCDVKKHQRSEPIQDQVPISDALDFSRIRNEVFGPRCISCHSQYKNYRNVKIELSAILDSVSKGRMPKRGGPLSQEQIQTLKDWIDQGAIEKVEQKPAPEPELQANWDSISSLLLTPKCLICHNPEGRAKFLDLSTRLSLFKARNQLFGENEDQKLVDFDQPENSYLLTIISDEEEPMPPPRSNIPRLTDREIETLREWISLGMP